MILKITHKQMTKNIYEMTTAEIALLMTENAVKQKDSYIIKNRGFVTASKLKAFRKSPEDYFLKYIVEMPSDKEESKSCKLGTAVDDYISYGEKEFNKKYFVPVKKMLKADWEQECITQGVEMPEKAKAEDLKKLAIGKRKELTDAEAKQVLGMIAEYKRQPLFDYDGGYETQKVLEFDYQGLKLKATLDRIKADIEGKEFGYLRDMKTTADIKKFNFACIDYGYDFSMSFYYVLANMVYDKKFLLILDAVQSSKTFASRSVVMPVETVEKQTQEQIIPLLNKLATMTKAWEKTKDPKVWTKDMLEKIEKDPTDEYRENLFDCEMYAQMETTIQKNFTYLQ